jgi:hypothetical protein
MKEYHLQGVDQETGLVLTCNVHKVLIDRRAVCPSHSILVRRLVVVCRTLSPLHISISEANARTVGIDCLDYHNGI